MCIYAPCTFVKVPNEHQRERGSQKGRSAVRRPKMIIATNHEHTHKTSQGSCKNAAAKVKLSFFVSLHLFQFCAKKNFFTILQLPPGSSSRCVCVFLIK